MTVNKFDKSTRDTVRVPYMDLSLMELIKLSRQGISKQDLLTIANCASLSIKELSTLLPVSFRTLQRYRNEDLLNPQVSERALLIAEVIDKGLVIFGNRKKLSSWLHSPILALGLRTPLSLLDTSFGIRMVSDTLGRIEYGIVA